MVDAAATAAERRMIMAKFRKKPVVIEAFRLNERGLIAEDWFWDAVTRNDIITHCFGKYEPDPAWCEIKTLEGTMIANAGDYIIQGVNGEIYPCKADIFQKIYTDDKPKTNAVTVQEWISVKDRLPDETGKYLAVKKRIAPDDFGGNRTDIVIIRFFADDGFRMPTHIPDWINKKIDEEVTHWMPLPQPPKGE